MRNSVSIDELFQELKEKDESTKLFVETADKTVKIIDKVVKARENLGLTQRDLAKKCGIKQPALARIETYKVIPKINTLIKLADAVGISIEAVDKIEKQTFQLMCKVGVQAVQLYSTEQANKFQKGENSNYRWKQNLSVSEL